MKKDEENDVMISTFYQLIVHYPAFILNILLSEHPNAYSTKVWCRKPVLLVGMVTAQLQSVFGCTCISYVWMCII